MAVLAGVLAADEDGKGRSIDLSQIEAAATLAGTPTLPRTTLNAVLAASDGAFIAVSVPNTAFVDEAALRQDFAGAGRADIIARCAALDGHAVDLLELDETDAAEMFADCSGWIASNHPYTGDEALVAAPWRIDGLRPGLRKTAPLLGAEDDVVLGQVLGLSNDEISALVDAGVVGIAGHFE